MDSKNYSLLIDMLDTYIWETEKRKENLFLIFVFWWWFFTFYLISMGLAILLREYSVALWLEYTLIFLGLTVVPWSIILGVLKMIEMKSENLKKFIEKTKNILYKYDSWRTSQDDIESILTQTREIHETLLFVYRYYKKNKAKIWDPLFFYIKDFEQSTLKALYEIESDLGREFHLQKDKLAQAKSMLEWENMKSIKTITKAQNIRLNERIRQFEVLDTILVRM